MRKIILLLVALGLSLTALTAASEPIGSERVAAVPGQTVITPAMQAASGYYCFPYRSRSWGKAQFCRNNQLTASWFNVADMKTDGHCVYVRYQNGDGRWWNTPWQCGDPGDVTGYLDTHGDKMAMDAYLYRTGGDTNFKFW